MSFSITRVCPSCGSRNRIPPQHLAHVGRCGSCKAQLPPQDEPIEADTEAFEAITSQSTEPVLVDFWAAWCGPCRVSAPEFQALARELAGQAVFLKVDVDAQPQLAARFNVSSIPYLVILMKGRPVYQQAGWPGRANLTRALQSLRARAATV